MVALGSQGWVVHADGVPTCATLPCAASLHTLVSVFASISLYSTVERDTGQVNILGAPASYQNVFNALL